MSPQLVILRWMGHAVRLPRATPGYVRSSISARTPASAIRYDTLPESTRSARTRQPRNAMKVTKVETIWLEEFSNVIWVQIHTDEGLIGLGETFFGAARGRSLRPRNHRALPARQGPASDRPACPRALRLCRLSLQRRRDARQLRARYRPLGPARQGHRPADLSAARRQVARHRSHLQHLRRLSLHPQRIRPGGRQLGHRRHPATRDPTKTSTASSTGPTSLPSACWSRASPA